MRRGITLIEVLLAVAIIGILTSIVLTSIVSYTKQQAIEKDAEAIVETLRQAKAQTFSGRDAATYGVHFDSSSVTFFTGSVYSSSDPDNQVLGLQTSDIVITTNLNGGGSDVVFEKLTGKTGNDGTITITSPSQSKTKTVTIYPTGVVQYQ